MRRDLREIEERLIANGRVEGLEIELLRGLLTRDGKVDREEADYLVELHKRVPHRSHAFEPFFYNMIKKHVLMDGRIGKEETEWLREMVFFNNKVEDEERKFLRELKGEAREVSPEFEAFFEESMKQPPERHTSGG
jgi:hypothetical protein